MQLKTIGAITGAVMAAFASSAFARGAENVPHTSQDQSQSLRALNATQRATNPVTTWWVLQQQQRQQLAISAEVNNYPCAPILNGHRTPLIMPFYVAARIQQALGLPVDGDCGPRTSRAITDELRRGDRARIGFTILEGQLVTVQGTGEVIRLGAHVQFSIR